MTQGEMAGIAVRVLSERMAKQEIKEQLRKQGVKLSYVPAREIIAQARVWLREHPEIIAEAKAKAKALGYVADQGRPTHSHSKSTAEPQSLTEIRLPAAEKSTSVSGLADGEFGTNARGRKRSLQL